MYEEITLIDRAVTSKDAAGFEVIGETVAASPVFAERKSAVRSEFYAAHAAGIRADTVFVLWRAEYNGEEIIRADDGDYSVVRTFITGPDKIELTCSKLGDSYAL